MNKSEHVPPGGYGYRADLHPPHPIEKPSKAMIVFKIIFRLIALPFYAIVLIISLIRVFILHMIHFVIYGGEEIAYNKTFNPQTIAALLQEYEKKMPFQDKVDELKKRKT